MCPAKTTNKLLVYGQLTNLKDIPTLEIESFIILSDRSQKDEKTITVDTGGTKSCHMKSCTVQVYVHSKFILGETDIEAFGVGSAQLAPCAVEMEEDVHVASCVHA